MGPSDGIVPQRPRSTVLVHAVRHACVWCQGPLASLASTNMLRSALCVQCGAQNTDTNETAWDLPDGQQLAPSTGMDPGSGAAPSTVASSAQLPVQDAELPLPPEQLYDALAAAYAADGSGMQFWEVARAHRSQGVFDDAFFDWLTRESRSGERAELAAKMMARLSNPLLRQPAPFEF